MNNLTKRNNLTKSNKKSNTKKNQKYFKKFKYNTKKLFKNKFLYASKKMNGQDLLEYTKKNQIINKEPCILNNISWFGSYNVAKSYQTHEKHLYQLKIKKDSLLL